MKLEPLDIAGLEALIDTSKTTVECFTCPLVKALGAELLRIKKAMPIKEPSNVKHTRNNTRTNGKTLP